jgi:hypothetical protein
VFYTHTIIAFLRYEDVVGYEIILGRKLWKPIEPSVKLLNMPRASYFKDEG